MGFSQIMRENDIAERFGHLFALYGYKAVMHPDFGKSRKIVFLPVCAAALRNFILMMREFQICAAAVNVKRQAEMFLRHGRTFDMPARATTAPWAVPARFISIRWFPENKIGRIFFISGNFDAGTCNLLVPAAAR